MSDECQCGKCQPDSGQKPKFSHFGLKEFQSYRVDLTLKSLRIDFTREGDLKFVFCGGDGAQSFLLSPWAIPGIIERLKEIDSFLDDPVAK